MRTAINLPEPKAIKFLFTDTRASWFWLLLRLFLGFQMVFARLARIFLVNS